MSARSFRPQLEELDSRVLPSANPAISISDVAVAEGDSGSTSAVFTVTLSAKAGADVTVLQDDVHVTGRGDVPVRLERLLGLLGGREVGGDLVGWRGRHEASAHAGDATRGP